MSSFFSQHSNIRPFLLCTLSAVLLILSFPNYDFGPLIWISLVPWLFALDGLTKRRAFGLGYLTGLIFFTLTLYWFLFVIEIAAIAFFLYLALYFGAFSAAYVLFAREKLWVRCLVLPSVWVALEFTRGNFGGGLSWVSLGHSQHHNWLFIQIADVTGVGGLSFLVVLVNLLIKENLGFVWGRTDVARPSLIRLNMIVLAVLIGVFAYGFWRTTRVLAPDFVKVGLVQGNIPQDEKWLMDQREAIISKYLKLSERALAAEPDILIWPETAFPGMAEETPELMERIRDFARRSSVPMILGIVTVQGEEYFNSAVLISSDGDIVDEYNKIHLVPFGEYLPFRKQFPFLGNLLVMEDFTSGRESTVFHQKVDGRDVPFSVAICFEDTLAYINRAFVLNGARFLVNITNDAWFEDSNEPFLHLQAAIFRSVEAKRSLVRAANTGVTGGIDPYGRPLKFLQDKSHKKTYVDGTAVFWVPLNSQITVYTKIGDIFTYLCFLCILWAGYRARKSLKKNIVVRLT